jgi:murein DD-endopeptidase MepM/ murein hydrolase activator NlpD
MYPVKNAIISQKYGAKSKRYKIGYHDGVDFACKTGTPVYAARKGVVSSSNWGADFGKHIVQRRTYPLGTKNHLVYAHLSKVFVKAGEKIKKGQLIGLSGNTGNSTAAHLHFGERNGAQWSTSKPVNPQQSLDA